MIPPEKHARLHLTFPPSILLLLRQPSSLCYNYSVAMPVAATTTLRIDKGIYRLAVPSFPGMRLQFA